MQEIGWADDMKQLSLRLFHGELQADSFFSQSQQVAEYEKEI